MNQRWLVLRLEAPLMAFGDVSIDHVGPTREHPSLSMVTGLLANALGLDWTETAAHDALQDRIVMASAIVDDAERVIDTQNAQLQKSDRGWTTRGMPEGRTGDSYSAPHRRRRTFIADAEARVALTLDPVEAYPKLDDLAAAVDRPARPIFIGRKSCLPTAPLNAGIVSAGSAHEALAGLEACAGWRAAWPEGQGPDGERVVDLPDRRNWTLGLHGGSRRVVQGRL